MREKYTSSGLYNSYATGECQLYQIKLANTKVIDNINQMIQNEHDYGKQNINDNLTIIKQSNANNENNNKNNKKRTNKKKTKTRLVNRTV